MQSFARVPNTTIRNSDILPHGIPVRTFTRESDITRSTLMLLETLVKAIEVIRSRIQNHRASLQANEIRTRMSLVDPLLTALGWDSANPADVTPEYELSPKRVDYALLDAAGKPAAFIEAKRLGESLESHRMQMVNYANLSGVPFAALTDGNRWELYKVFEAVPIEDKRILTVSIAGNESPHKCALQLLVLWRPNLGTALPIPASTPVLESLLLAASPSAPSGNPMVPKVNGNWVLLSGLSLQSGTSPPSAIRFPDNSTKAIKTWRAVLTSTADWLGSNNKLSMSNSPVRKTPKKHLVHSEPRHPDGTDFKGSHEVLGTSLVVECHLSAINCIKQTKSLLTACGVDSASIGLQLEG